MLNYSTPSFNFSAPTKFIRRNVNITKDSSSYRSEFSHDRDRILYSSAFRRLAGKTQIYLIGKDDNQRNRLTHTLEVAQIARTISSALCLNSELTEAIALGHDLGHSPFGHAGEQVLHEIMIPNSKIIINKSPMNDPSLSESEEIKKYLFGFKHNVQSVRIAAYLEHDYNQGLNLTNYTLWGILHHSSSSYKPHKINSNYATPTYMHQFKNNLYVDLQSQKEAWSFEAFVVKKADDIAQWNHDLEDALRGNAMTGADVCHIIKANLGIFMNPQDSTLLNQVKKRKQINNQYISDLSKIVINTLINRIIECSLYNLTLLWNEKVKTESNKLNFFSQHNWYEPDIINAIGFKKKGEINRKIDLFQTNYPKVISEKIHHSREVERMNAKGKYIIRKLFQAYYSHPQQLPDRPIIQYMIEIGELKNYKNISISIGSIREKFEIVISDKRFFSIDKRIQLMRVITDYISGMTDRYAIQEFRNLYY